MITDIQEVYKEDTVGRKYHTPIITKKNNNIPAEPPATEAITINLNAPISRNEFKKISDSLKILYIKNIRQKYGASAGQIAQMLGYTQSHFSTAVVTRLNLKGLFRSRPKQTKKQQTEWKKFLKNGIEDQKAPTTKSSVPAMFCNCSFTLKGELRMSDISERIHAMVADGTPCSISVAINALDKHGIDE